ncbi:radical SAM protein [Archaeoglobus neptunius]|uniref:radical SAM protein n=1 Tax=Archaeoglobus neptunius TaxID=2798580 RepID=UPI0019253D0F|nr:radical SAM protein [Archaeoglobus neptunius]
MRAAIIDGYVDEPSCLGVPPYISPYPRYIHGMLKELGYNPLYITIDSLRKNYKLQKNLRGFDLAIIIAGIAVPGKYIGGNPMSKKELFSANFARRNILVGPITLELSRKEKEMLADCNIEVVDFPFEKKLVSLFDESVEFSIDRFAVAGADVVRQHPDFPNVICEIETYRGCYWGRCSFCIERIHSLWIRDPRWILREIKALYDSGVRYFRLGRQTDFFTYLADFSREIPVPDPERLKGFHRAIWRLCPGIRTLHLDNVNPKTIAEYPEESREIVKTVVLYQTPGNVAAMGLESADERVIRKNSLCASPEDVMEAVELVNRYGRYPGYNGLPYFLPGLNFVIGLRGETKETFDANYEFLEELVEKGLLLRRINIRQVKIFPGTPMEKEGGKRLRKHRKYFFAFKHRVRENIDRPMFRKILPKGRKITDLRVEVEGEKVSYARQLATYPVLVGLIGRYPGGSFVDARVVDYGQRSVTAIEAGLDVNAATVEQLEYVLGKLSREVYIHRPITSERELEEIAGREALLYFTVGAWKN